ncbi:unnamed protein product, partial [Brassica napus]
LVASPLTASKPRDEEREGEHDDHNSITMATCDHSRLNNGSWHFVEQMYIQSLRYNRLDVPLLKFLWPEGSPLKQVQDIAPLPPLYSCFQVFTEQVCSSSTVRTITHVVHHRFLHFFLLRTLSVRLLHELPSPLLPHPPARQQPGTHQLPQF